MVKSTVAMVRLAVCAPDYKAVSKYMSAYVWLLK